MKPNELMIGDWVYNKHHQKNIKITPYDFFTHTHNKYGEQELAAYAIPTFGNDLEPIPITPEILEKNGFIKDRRADEYHLLVPNGFERESFTIQVSLYREPICGVRTLVKCWGRIPPYNGGMNDIHLCSANYVHQLQHALRLCGIEKQIEL